MATLSQTFADSLKKKYKSLADVQATSARWGMTPDVQAQISWFYTAPTAATPNSTSNISPVNNQKDNLLWWTSLVDTGANKINASIPTSTTAPTTASTAKLPAWVKSIDYKAPNDKPYTLIETSRGTYFKWSDGENKMFNTTAEAQAYINSNNPKWSTSAVSEAQANFNKKYSTTYWQGSPVFSDVGSDIQAPEDTSNWTQEDWDNLKRDQKVDSLKKSLTKSFNEMSVWNTEFKKLVDDNLATQLLKNKTLQESLAAQKRESDAAFKWIETKFTDNQKAALARVDEMESKWMENFNKIQEQTAEYYKDQSSALDASLGWEQAWLAGSMAAKWVNEWVIANALAQAKEAHQWQYNALLKNNTEIMKQLNNDYLNFFKDVQSERGKWSTDELALMKEKFTQAKTFIDASKTLSDTTINASFKPFEDAIAKASEAQANQAWFAATDQARIARYKESTPEQRKLMLMAQLGLDDSTLAYGTTSNFDIALLDKAVSAWDLSEAIRILGKWYKAAIDSGANINSPVMKAIEKKINDAKSELPKVDESKPEDKPEEPKTEDVIEITPVTEVEKETVGWTAWAKLFEWLSNLSLDNLQKKIYSLNQEQIDVLRKNVISNSIYDRKKRALIDYFADKRELQLQKANKVTKEDKSAQAMWWDVNTIESKLNFTK